MDRGGRASPAPERERAGHRVRPFACGSRAPLRSSPALVETGPSTRRPGAVLGQCHHHTTPPIDPRQSCAESPPKLQAVKRKQKRHAAAETTRESIILGVLCRMKRLARKSLPSIADELFAGLEDMTVPSMAFFSIPDLEIVIRIGLSATKERSTQLKGERRAAGRSNISPTATCSYSGSVDAYLAYIPEILASNLH